MLDKNLQCANGHGLSTRDGIVQLMSEPKKEMVETFLQTFEKYRKDQQMLLEDEQIFPKLPYAHHDGAWRLKQMEWEMIRQMLPSDRSWNILDMGAWNGWLSYQLASAGHTVVATGLFTNPWDGLGAQRHYPVDFDTIQMETEDIHLLEGSFDLVVLNKGFPFLTDRHRFTKLVKEKTTSGGWVIATGINIYRHKNRQLEQIKADFEKTYGPSFFLRPVKGYLNKADANWLKDKGFVIKTYKNGIATRLRNALASVGLRDPQICYAVWKNEGS
jgi:2-polyprenyl-3-methyl-5-hydroxy-6-metoxy-1,4-benzoquinol methylase